MSKQHEATQAGITILNQGGNAIDAAVGVGYALAVTYPCCGNLGGSGFMLIRFANGRTRFLDFREMAPGAATPNMYLDTKGQVIPRLRNQGYLTVGVLGTVKGLDYALKTYGTRSHNLLMTAAITLAERGFTLQAADAALLQDTKTFRTQPNVVSIFLKDGQPYQSSDRLVQFNLARSLHLITDPGADAFDHGAIADQLIAASQQGQGILTKADLAKYAVRDTVPLQCQYHNYQILTAPPPGGGVTLCEMLNILEGYPQSDDLSQTLHRRLSAMLFAYADRNAKLGDPAFVDNELNQLLSKSYIVLAEPYALTNKVFQQLWRMGYHVVGFPNWGAAESIAIDPTTKTIYGLHDSRKRTGSAIAQKSCSGSSSWQCN